MGLSRLRRANEKGFILCDRTENSVRSALGWFIDQYQVSTDKANIIVNAPNAWARGHDYQRYILDLVLRILELSVRTVGIVRGFAGAGVQKRISLLSMSSGVSHTAH